MASSDDARPDLLALMSSPSYASLLGSPKRSRFDLFGYSKIDSLSSFISQPSSEPSPAYVAPPEPRAISPSPNNRQQLSAFDGLEAGLGIRRRAELLDPAVISPRHVSSLIVSDKAQWRMAADRYKSGLSPSDTYTQSSPAARSTVAKPVVVTNGNQVGRRPEPVVQARLPAPDSPSDLHPHSASSSLSRDDKLFNDPRVKAWRVYKAVLKVILEDLLGASHAHAQAGVSAALANLDQYIAVKVNAMAGVSPTEAERIYAEITAKAHQLASPLPSPAATPVPAPAASSPAPSSTRSAHFAPGPTVAGVAPGDTRARPVTSRSYLSARTLYPFTGVTASGELSFRAGTAITVLQHDHAQWWYGDAGTGKRGWFPKSYVEVLPTSPHSSSPSHSVSHSGQGTPGVATLGSVEAAIAAALGAGDNSDPQALVNAIIDAIATQPGEFATGTGGSGGVGGGGATLLSPVSLEDAGGGSKRVGAGTPVSAREIVRLLAGKPVTGTGTGKGSKRRGAGGTGGQGGTRTRGGTAPGTSSAHGVSIDVDDVGGEGAASSSLSSPYASDALLARADSAGSQRHFLTTGSSGGGGGGSGAFTPPRPAGVGDMADVIADAWLRGEVAGDDAVDPAMFTHHRKGKGKGKGSGGTGNGPVNGSGGRYGHDAMGVESDSEDDTVGGFDFGGNGGDTGSEDESVAPYDSRHDPWVLGDSADGNGSGGNVSPSGDGVSGMSEEQRRRHAALVDAGTTAAKCGVDPTVVSQLAEASGVPAEAIAAFASNLLANSAGNGNGNGYGPGGYDSFGDGSGVGPGGYANGGAYDDGTGVGPGGFFNGGAFGNGSGLGPGGWGNGADSGRVGYGTGGYGGYGGDGSGVGPGGWGGGEGQGGWGSSGGDGSGPGIGGGGGSSAQPAMKVVVGADGRRAKVLVMDGSELWDLFRRKLRALAFCIHFAKAVRRRRLATKAMAVGMLVAAERNRKPAQRRARLFAVGLLRLTARRRLFLQVAPKMFILGALASFPRTRPTLAAAARQVSRALNAVKSLQAPEDPNAPKTRAIHWDALGDASVHGTIWDREQNAGKLSARPKSMVVDMSSLMPDLVEKFALNAAVKPEAGRANPLSTKAADKIMLLDPRKAQNVGIALSSVVGRRTHEEVRNALHQVDEELFGGGIDRVQLLLNLGIFTDEVLSPVREYDGDVTKLAPPERFIKEVVLQVPSLPLRLAVMEFKLVLPELINATQERLACIATASSEITTSQRFATLLLDVILPLGNKLNALSRKGTAAGFKLSSLNKLIQTKSGNGETFLRFIVEGLLERSPKLAGVSDDFPVLLRARGPLVAVPLIQESIAKVEKGVRQVESLIAASAGSGDWGMGPRLSALLSVAKSAFTELRGDFKKVNGEFEELCRWLGEDPSKSSPEAVFGIMQAFLSAFNVEVRACQERMERATKAEARKTKEAAASGGNAKAGGEGAATTGSTTGTSPNYRRVRRRASRAIVNAVLSGGSPEKILATIAAEVSADSARAPPSLPPPPGQKRLGATSPSPPPPTSTSPDAMGGSGSGIGSGVEPRRASKRVSLAGVAVAAALAAANSRGSPLSGISEGGVESPSEFSSSPPPSRRSLTGGGLSPRSPEKVPGGSGVSGGFPVVASSPTALAPPPAGVQPPGRRLSIFDIRQAQLNAASVAGTPLGGRTPPQAMIVEDDEDEEEEEEEGHEGNDGDEGENAVGIKHTPALFPPPPGRHAGGAPYPLQPSVAAHTGSSGTGSGSGSGDVSSGGGGVGALLMPETRPRSLQRGDAPFLQGALSPPPSTAPVAAPTSGLRPAGGALRSVIPAPGAPLPPGAAALLRPGSVPASGQQQLAPRPPPQTRGDMPRPISTGETAPIGAASSAKKTLLGMVSSGSTRAL